MMCSNVKIEVNCIEIVNSATICKVDLTTRLGFK